MSNEVARLEGLQIPGVRRVQGGRVLDGIQIVFEFENGRELSVIRHSGSYGNKQGEGLFEAWDGVSDEVHGWLTPEDVEELVREHAAFPALEG